MATVTIARPVQLDIQYAPDREKWQARVASRVQEPDLPKALPEGLPAQFKSDLVWEGSTLANDYDWTYVLSTEQLDELDAALAHFKSLGLALGHINQETFPLPKLHSELRKLSYELHNGHGFFVIRGLRVDEHTREENIIIYAGLSSHIAPQRGRQDRQYDGKPADVVLTHIKDLTLTKEKGQIGSPAYTADKQVFHTDAGDIVSLFALSTAAEGGTSKLASIARVYNEIAKTRPDLVHTLTQDWQFEVFGTPQKSFTSRPLVHYQPATATTPERLAVQYARRYFVGYGALPRSVEIPPISEAQAEALDTLHFLGEKFAVSLDFQKGDIQYANNMGIFHARDGFTDTQDQQRHLLRQWLRDPEYAWETPEPLKERWGQLYDGVTPDAQVFPLEPFIRSEGNKILSRYLWRIAGKTPSAWELKGVAIAAYTFAVICVVAHNKYSLWATNIIGAIKIITLIFISITGLVVLGGHVDHIPDPNANFRNSFEGTTDNGNDLATALVNIIFSYTGYSNAFNVVNEIKNPIPVLKRHATISVVVVAVLYMFCNVAYFAAVPKAEFKTAKEIAAAVFFTKVFGTGPAEQALNFLVLLSAFGNLLGVLIGSSRVIREIGRSVVISLKTYPDGLFHFAMAVGVYLIRLRRKRAGLGRTEFKSWHVTVIFFILLQVYILVMPWWPPKGGPYAGSVSFWYATYCVVGIAM
ncbi:Taurine hydroxylase-like protein SAT17 [Colletotrichum sp. SAR11_240]|nr:Taurine hydroxylase-like protein SAT17 [Colletotrichum sp. SAR11_240]